MERIRTHLVLVLLMFSGVVTVNASELEDGLVAFNKRDFVEARKHWAQMARQGNATAQYYLGYLYQTGKGVELNSREAYQWFQKAAAGGNRLAEHQLLNQRARQGHSKESVNLARR